MQSKLVNAIALATSPIAVILTDEKPEAALQFKEGGWGCVAATMLGVSKGKTAVFDRQSYGCPGTGVPRLQGLHAGEREWAGAVLQVQQDGDREASRQRLRAQGPDDRKSQQDLHRLGLPEAALSSWPEDGQSQALPL